MTHPDFWLARESSADPADLSAWAGHEHAEVRLAVAQNPSTTAETAQGLLNDPDDAVACAALARPDTDPAQLDRAALSDRPALRAQAACDPRTSVHLVNGELARDPDPGVLLALLENSNTGAVAITVVLEAVKSLSPKRQFPYKAQAARNPNVSETELTRLAGDKHPFVREAAGRELVRRGLELPEAPPRSPRRRASVARGI